MQLTEDQINQLAPDPASIKAGTKVFNKTNWAVSKSDRAVWAQIKGSGTNPYFVQIDILNLAFKCTCPSRKFPCKHSLALGYFIAKNGAEAIDLAEKEPIWVQEWVDKRTAKTTNQVAKPKKVQSSTAIKKKRNEKWSKAIKGIESVEHWLIDVVKLGILIFPSKDLNYWEDLARRMVDAKLPGINTYFQSLAAIDYQQKNWEEGVLQTLSKLHLLTQAIKNHKQIDPVVKVELELLMGWNINKKDLIANPKTEVVADVWRVIKIVKSSNDGLDSRKVYLYGIQTNRFAYILEFAFGSTLFKDNYLIGGLFEAKLAFFPGVQKTRAFVKIKGNQTDVVSNLEPILDLSHAHAQYIQRIQQFAWTFEVEQFIAQVNVVARDEIYYLVDKADFLLPIGEMDYQKYISLLAHTQGYFFDAFVVRNEDGIRLLGLMKDEQYMAI